MGIDILGHGLELLDDTLSVSQTYVDDIALKFGTGGTVSLIYETADANANAMLFVAPEGGATDVPAFIFGDASALNSDLGWFNGLVEPSLVVINDAKDAYVSIDAGDDSIASSKGFYFKAAADEDIELLNLSITGTPRVYWDESEDQFRSTKGWVFDAACDVQGTWVATAAWTLPAFTQGGTITVTGQVFDAGAGSAEIDTTGGGEGLTIKTTSSGATGARLLLIGASSSPAAADDAAAIIFQGRDSAANPQTYGSIYVIIDDPINTSEDATMQFWVSDTGSQNLAATLAGTGVFSVDLAGVGTAAQVDLFDDYDDALMLRQGIQENNRELLTNMGVLTKKDTGSGYMMNLQPMVKLLAGGIYQSRALIDRLADRLDEMERTLLLGRQSGKAIEES